MSLQSIPAESFDSNKTDQSLLVNEKLDQQRVDSLFIHTTSFKI